MTHTFPTAERQFVQARVQQINELTAQLRGAIGLYVATHELQGEWDMLPDGTGIVQVGSNTPEPVPADSR